jgi:hypothetical protein
LPSRDVLAENTARRIRAYSENAQACQFSKSVIRDGRQIRSQLRPREGSVDEHRGMARSPQAAEASDIGPVFIPAGSDRARLKRRTLAL